ncbi:MAG: NAD(P)H-dependent oxidoreductase [Bacteroidetes bacterium]|nr:NAD(P)H-dependent oxidoreductase [Bacteroidota bacterium]
MKLAMLIGSCRVGRQSHMICDHLRDRLSGLRIAVDIIDLGVNLPSGSFNGYAEPPNALQWQDVGLRMAGSDGLIFITPEYHGSFSGLLKMAIDYFGEQCRGKPIGVVTVSTGKMGGSVAAMQLQHVILSLGAFPLPTRLLVPEVASAFDGKGSLVNERASRAAARFIEDYTWFAEALYARRTGVHVPDKILNL